MASDVKQNGFALTHTAPDAHGLARAARIARAEAMGAAGADSQRLGHHVPYYVVRYGDGSTKVVRKDAFERPQRQPQESK